MIKTNIDRLVEMSVQGKVANPYHRGMFFVDDSGISACRRQVPERLAAMRARLKQLSAATLDVQRELEYWQTQSLQTLYRRQQPQLERRIEQALLTYKERFPSLFRQTASR